MLPLSCALAALTFAALSGGERREAALVVLAPSPRAELESIVAQLFAERTGLYLAPPDLLGISECRGALGCIALKVSENAKYLLVLSVKRSEDADVIRAVWLDLVRARSFGSAPSEELEDAVFKEAVLARPPPLRIAGPAETRATLSRLFDEHLRPSLETAGEWAPFGSIEIRDPRGPAEVRLDGRTIGELDGETTRVFDVRAGKRRLTLTRSSSVARTLDVDVKKGDVARFDLTPHHRATDLPISLVVGTGALLAGAALITAGAIASSSTDTGVLCTGGPGAEINERCGGSRYRRVAGVPAVPLAIGLMIAGASWAISWLLDADDWPELTSGLAAGVLVSSVLLVADGAEPR